MNVKSAEEIIKEFEWKSYTLSRISIVLFMMCISAIILSFLMNPDPTKLIPPVAIVAFMGVMYILGFMYGIVMFNNTINKLKSEE